MMKTYGYYRLAAATPRVRVAHVESNVDALVETMKTAVADGAAVVVFPELCVTGASCGDLFFQPRLQKAAVQGLLRFAAETAEWNAVAR